MLAHGLIWNISWVKKFVFFICLEGSFFLASIRWRDNGCRHTW